MTLDATNYVGAGHVAARRLRQTGLTEYGFTIKKKQPHIRLICPHCWWKFNQMRNWREDDFIKAQADGLSALIALFDYF